jgi:hypothetical protein
MIGVNQVYHNLKFLNQELAPKGMRIHLTTVCYAPGQSQGFSIFGDP